MIHFILIVTDKREKGKGGREGERGREKEREGERRREKEREGERRRESNSFIENLQV